MARRRRTRRKRGAFFRKQDATHYTIVIVIAAVAIFAVLQFAPTGKFTGSYDSNSGEVTFSGACDSAGDVTWQATYGGSLIDFDTIASSDGSFSGSFAPSDDGDYDISIVCEDGTLINDITVCVGDEVVCTSANQPPTASFTVTPASGEATLSVQLDASASYDPDGSIVSYEYVVDGGSSGTLTNPVSQAIFEIPGTYDVVLTVTDDDGATATATQTVTVTAPSYVDTPPPPVPSVPGLTYTVTKGAESGFGISTTRPVSSDDYILGLSRGQTLLVFRLNSTQDQNIQGLDNTLILSSFTITDSSGVDKTTLVLSRYNLLVEDNYEIAVSAQPISEVGTYDYKLTVNVWSNLPGQGDYAVFADNIEAEGQIVVE